MATTKTFTITGSTTYNNKTKIRWANDIMRIKQLVKHGHKDIDLIELPKPMTKPEIVEYLDSTGYGQGNPKIESALRVAIKKNGKKLETL